MAIENLKIAFFIQARMGSNRLPGKVLMPFDGDKSILEIITSKIKANFKEIPLVICTSEAQIDDEIISFCNENNLDYYRGSEQNVLQRFLDAAAFHNVDIIIRVCADNPFLSVDFLNELLAYFYKNQDADYWSFKNAQEIPVIKTHFGFFAEIVTKEALQKVIQNTNDNLYLEHVTNYIYTHPDFKCKLKNLPEYLNEREDLRFTIDDDDDFSILQLLYQEHTKNKHDLKKTILYIDENKVFLDKMKNNINKYSK